MLPKELPANISAKVNEWLCEPSILHFWQMDDTFLVVARINGGSDIYCLRVFPCGDTLVLSQDNVLYA